jgi:translation elongation factor EF-Tu-like GTPase
MYVIGTAGHVDHGKSTLVKALTNIDPDRLPGLATPPYISVLSLVRLEVVW